MRDLAAIIRVLGAEAMISRHLARHCQRTLAHGRDVMIRSSGPVVPCLAHSTIPRHTVDVSSLSQEALIALRRGGAAFRDGHAVW